MRGEYRLTGADGAASSAADLEAAAQVVRARLNRMGLASFEVATGADSKILVEMGSMNDPDEVRELIHPTGSVQFVPIPLGVAITPGAAIPAGLSPLFGREGIAVVRVDEDPESAPTIEIALTPEASQVFAAHTRRHVGEQFAVVLDAVVFSAPIIQSVVEGVISISGGSDATAMNRLVTILLVPPMPGTLDELSFVDVVPPPGCVAVE